MDMSYKFTWSCLCFVLMHEEPGVTSSLLKWKLHPSDTQGSGLGASTALRSPHPCVRRHTTRATFPGPRSRGYVEACQHPLTLLHGFFEFFSSE